MSDDKESDAPAAPVYKMPVPPNQPIYQPRMAAPPPSAPGAPVTPALMQQRPELPGIGQELQTEVGKLREELDLSAKAYGEMAAIITELEKTVTSEAQHKAAWVKRVDDLQGLVGGMARDEQPTLERVSAIEKRVGELAQVVAELREELGDGGEDDDS